MIKRTLYFGNPAYLSTSNQQMVIHRKEPVNKEVTVPLEDIALVILDHQQITITQTLMSRLLENNVALITCDDKHLPCGMFFNLESHTLQSQRFKYQIEAPQPLKKQLWQQTIQAKIFNQAQHLKAKGHDSKYLFELAKNVRSGDSSNAEAVASAYYWKHLFAVEMDFFRDRYGMPPNNLLNYGYSILRACVARSLSGSGLLSTLGIFHRNQYNAYCLADDVMEPFRPYVDYVVSNLVEEEGAEEFILSPATKQKLLQIPAMDVMINNQKSPLLVALQRTTSSLARSFEERTAQLLYPEFHFTCSSA